MADEALDIGGVEVRKVDETASYELGAEIGGHWQSFVRIPAPQLESNVSNAQEQAKAASAGADAA